MLKDDYVLWFKDMRKEDIPLVGGKCANLGEVSGRLGIPGLDMESVIKTIQ
jgi:phosphoenolpyruvate synthase/pyruvate phosphate dikinase